MKLPSSERRRLLTAEEERTLLKQSLAGDVGARDILVLHNQGLVINIVARYRQLANKKGMTFDDLIQEGNMGLIKAIDRFKLNKNTRLSTYATWWIKQGVDRAVIEKGDLVTTPHRIVRKHYKLQKQQDQEKRLTGKEIKFLSKGIIKRVSTESLGYVNYSVLTPDLANAGIVEHSIIKFINSRKYLSKKQKEVFLMRAGLGYDKPMNFYEIARHRKNRGADTGHKIFMRARKKLIENWSEFKTI
jgi:RNA polymerase sigma factor (sigma-70 family)